MKPFRPNKQQLEALGKVATKLFIPLGEHTARIVLGVLETYDGIVHELCVNGNPYEKDILLIEGMLESGIYDTEYMLRFFNSCDLLDIEFYSPLQPNEEYFVQVEQVETGPCAGIPSLGVPAMDVVTATVPADQMTEEQSNYKFRVTGVEVEQLHEIYERGGGWDLLSLYPSASITDDFIDWYDRQYPEQPYSIDPRGFLVTIERI